MSADRAPLPVRSRPASASPAARSGDATVLCINRGSSSLKFGLYAVVDGRADALLHGQSPVDDDLVGGDAGARDQVPALAATDVRGRVWSVPARRDRSDSDAGADATAVLHDLHTLLRRAGMPPVAAVAHRIVHGGPALHAHRIVDSAALLALDDAVPFARLHMPPSLALLRAATARFPSVPQVACLDTAFHHDMPDVARVLPIAQYASSLGLRRYGFHGLSCESIVHALGDDLPERTVVAHLGHGASVTAILAGRSVDTSMGLTPAGGVVMGTRSGDVDPGLLVHLLRTQPLDAIDIERRLVHGSGMLGVSGISGDMRVLHAAAPRSAPARLAIAMFCQSVAKQVAAMVAVLDGVDLLVFTGGIGEHDPSVRDAICTRLRWFGVRLEDRANAASRQCIEGPDSRCEVRVMPSDEDAEMARIAARLRSRSGDAAAPVLA